MGQFNHLPPQQQADAWVMLMTARERELMEQGMTKEQAEEQACAEIRREIRTGK